MKKLWDWLSTPLDSLPQMLKATSFFATLGLLSWLLIFLATEAKSLHYYLIFPDDKNLSVEFSGKLLFVENELYKTIGEGEYHFRGTFLAQPKTLKDGATYKTVLRKLFIHDHKGRLVIGYEKHSPNLIEYSCDPRWSDNERTAIYESFKINFEEIHPSDDHSLLHEDISFFLDATGQISEISLPPQLRKAIYSATESYACGSLLRNVIASPEYLPALFSETTDKRRWETEGDLLGPFTMKHTVLRKFGKLLSIRSKISPYSRDQRGLRGKELLSRHFNLDWRYDTEHHFVPSIDVEVSSAVKGKLFDAESAYNYKLTAKLLLTLEKQEAIIDEEI